MKKDVHPTDYRTVVFQDSSNNDMFMTKSTAPADETIKWEDGNEYPLIKIHISRTSHPFYTGQEKIVDIEGRVDRFKAQAEKAKKAREARAKAAQKKSTQSDEEKPEQEAVKVGGNRGQTNAKNSKPQKDQ